MILTDAERAAIVAAFPESGLTDVELRDAVDETDDFLEANLAAYNVAIPQPARTILTDQFKALLFLRVTDKRYGVFEMPITDPEATNFLDTYGRPFAERVRDLQAFGNEMVAAWNGGISTLYSGQDAEIVQDQNVDNHPVTGADVTNTVTRSMQILDGAGGYEAGGGLNGANMMDAILALVVRTI